MDEAGVVGDGETLRRAPLLQDFLLYLASCVSSLHSFYHPESGARFTDDRINSERLSNLPKITQLVHCWPLSLLQASRAPGSHLPEHKRVSDA